MSDPWFVVDACIYGLGLVAFAFQVSRPRSYKSYSMLTLGITLTLLLTYSMELWMSIVLSSATPHDKVSLKRDRTKLICYPLIWWLIIHMYFAMLNHSHVWLKRLLVSTMINILFILIFYPVMFLTLPPPLPKWLYDISYFQQLAYFCVQMVALILLLLRQLGDENQKFRANDSLTKELILVLMLVLTAFFLFSTLGEILLIKGVTNAVIEVFFMIATLLKTFYFFLILDLAMSRKQNVSFWAAW